MMVMILTGAGLAALAGMLAWTSMVAKNSERHNLYLKGMTMTDSALEKVMGSMIRDYQTNDYSYVSNHLSTYRTLIPTSDDSALFASYIFSDLTGASNQISVNSISNWSFGTLASKFTGLKGYSATYQVTAAATDMSSPEHIPVTVQQQLQLASIPIFTFGIFYNLDLEVCPSGTFDVTGRVHCNRNVYTDAPGTLTFQSHVTALGKINRNNSPYDPISRTIGTITYQGDSEGGLAALTLPMGTNNSPDVLREIVEPAPLGESTNSLYGRQRYYNKAELIIRVQTNSVSATSGAYNGFSVPVPWIQSSGIVGTNDTFFDRREYQDILVTEIDVSKIITQYANFTALLGRTLKTIYVIDDRLPYFPYWKLAGVRLINGQTLPANGLTVATPHPLYIQGHYNVPTAYLGTTNTTQSLPASIAADSLTILSSAWVDSKGGSGLSQRKATVNTTVNVAAIAGIVPSDGSYYSGGAENFFRLLQDWTSRTLTFNGSMVALYDSRQAVYPWGWTSAIFRAPTTRKYGWDSRYQTTNLPPSTPFLSATFRSRWTTLQSTNAP